MKKLFIRVITIITTSIVLYIGVITLLITFNCVNILPNSKYTIGGYGYTMLRLEEVKKQRDLDILFVGSSHVYRAFDPRIFEDRGIRVFNLGSSAQSPIYTYHLLEEHLTYLKPKKIVMDLYWEMLATSSVEAGVDLISNSEPSESSIKMVWASKDIVLLNAYVINLINRCLNSIDHTSQKTYPNHKYVKGGFVESFEKQNESAIKGIRKKEIEINSVQLEYLHKIEKLCKNNNIKLIYVVTPVTEEYFKSISNYKIYSNLINKIAIENGSDLYDFNSQYNIGLNSMHDFYDENHLNQYGVEKFDKYFIQILE